MCAEGFMFQIPSKFTKVSLPSFVTYSRWLWWSPIEQFTAIIFIIQKNFSLFSRKHSHGFSVALQSYTETLYLQVKCEVIEKTPQDASGG